MNNKTGQPIRVWALLGPHRGDNNQVLALTEALGLPFEEKWLRYSQLRRLQPALLGATLKSVSADTRAQLEGEPPDLTISTGHRSVPVVRALRKRSGGKMATVHLGYPRISPAYFDLVVPTPEYPVPDAPNVVRIPFALSAPPATASAGRSKSAALEALPRPRHLFVIGGPTLYWELPEQLMLASLRRLIDGANNNGGSVLAIGSPRTPQRLLDSIVNLLAKAEVPTLVAPREGSPSYGELLHAADRIYVTADSVAMVADAVNTGKPVGIVPIAKSPLGRVTMAAADRLRPGKRLYPRDLRFFWASLSKYGFGGTIDEPRASDPPDFTADIADRVRRLLRSPDRRATAGRDNAR